MIWCDNVANFILLDVFLDHFNSVLGQIIGYNFSHTSDFFGVPNASQASCRESLQDAKCWLEINYFGFINY
jgi:hypothetical protein